MRRHAVLTYFALTLALSWGGWLLLTGGAPMRSDSRFMVMVLVGPVAPAAAGLLMTSLTTGRPGYRQLLDRLLRWQLAARWYGVALLLAPLVAIVTTVLLALSHRSLDFLPVVFTTADPLGLLLPGVIGGALVGFLEELGWTGFAVPRLRLGHGILASGLVVGLFWGGWHAPLFSRRDSFAAALPLALLLLQLFSWLPAFRILMVWVYDRTGSLLITMLMHASLSATSIILPPPAMTDLQTVTTILTSAAIWWLLVAAVAVANRRRPSGGAAQR
jgi:membrane protease YdiL (CAAX protease family)